MRARGHHHASGVLCLFLFGCGTQPAVDPCEPRLTQFEERLTWAAVTSEPAGAPPQVPLPTSAHGVPRRAAAPLLVVSVDEVSFAGRGVGGGDDLTRIAETLRADMSSWARVHRLLSAEEIPVLLWAAPDVPARRLVRLLRHTPANVRYHLLVRGAARPPSPSEPAWVGPALRGRSGRPESERERVEAAWARVSEGCPGIAPHMPTPAPLTQVGLLLGPPAQDELVGAVRDCGCASADVDAIEAVAMHALVAPAGPVLRLASTLRFGPPTDAADAVPAAQGQDVQALIERYASRTGPLWVEER